MKIISANILQFVTFSLGDEEYAVDILKVQEINRMREITKIPNSPDHMDGVINLRGKIVPVVNLRKLLDLPDVDSIENRKIIIINTQGMTVGMVVDAVSDVLRVPESVVEPPPIITHNADGNFVSGIVKLENRLIMLLDIDRLIGKEKVQGIVTVEEKNRS